MIKINLLRGQARNRSFGIFRLLGFKPPAYLSYVFLSVAVLLYVVSVWHLSYTQDNVRVLQERLSLLNSAKQRVLEAKGTEIKTQISSFVGDINARKPYGVLATTNAVLAALPRGIWLEKISIGPKEVLIGGSATAAVPSYVRALKKDGHLFRAVALVSLRQKGSEYGKIQGFLIKCERKCLTN